MKTKMRDENGFTPLQGAIMRILQDGEWHRRDELTTAIDNDRKALSTHIRDLRRMLTSRGLLIFYSLTTTNGPGYQLARKLSSLKDGGG